MTNKMLIDAAHPEETRVVVVRDKKVEDFDFETASKKPLRGNIYLAKVTRVEPSLQAAFVEYGGNRHGFLAFSEIHPDYYQIPQADRAALLEDERDEEPEPEQKPKNRRRGGRSRSRNDSGADAAETADTSASASAADTDDAPASVVDVPIADASDGAVPTADEPAGKHADAATNAEAAATDPHADAEPAPAADTEPDATPTAVTVAAATAAETLEATPTEASAVDALPNRDGSDASRAEASGNQAAVAADTASSADTDSMAAASNAPATNAADTPVETAEAAEDAPKPKTRRRRTTTPRTRTTKKTAEGLDDDVVKADADTSDNETADNDASDNEPSRGASRASDRGGRRSRGQRDNQDGEASQDEDDEITSLGNQDAMEEVPERRRRTPKKVYKIQDVIKRRQILLVQVVKEERGTKGAALTTYLSLAGRYSVLMPNTDRGGGVSRKITDNTDRKRLKELVAELDVPKGMGIILRTAGAARTKTEIKRDFEYLLRLWESVRDLTLRSVAPQLVYEEGNLVKRSIRDLYNKEIHEVLVAGETAYREAKDFMKMLMPSHAKNVKPYREATPIFTAYAIEPQLDAMFSPQVTLPSKGSIVINPTEALVAIDVNSGKSTKEANIEETAYKTNLEAADEVARQLRLRDLAGLIVIDFIDMDDKRHNRAVEKRLKDALRLDRSRIQLGRISPFGLMEMSRQRMRQGMVETSMVGCPACSGTGLVRSTQSVALHCLRALEEHLLKRSDCHVTLKTSSGAALYILNQKRAHLNGLEARFGLTIGVDADESLTGQHFEIVPGARVERAVGEAVPTAQIAPDAVLPEDDNADDVVDTASTDAAADDGESGERSGRRRRRRRRRGGGDDVERTAGDGPRMNGTAERDADDAAGDGTALAAAARTGDAEARPADDTDAGDEANGVNGAERNAADAGDDGDDDPDNLRRGRRRGRRGGRRHRRQDDEVTANGEDRSDAPLAAEAPTAETVGDAPAAEETGPDASDASVETANALGTDDAPAASESAETEAAEANAAEAAATSTATDEAPPAASANAEAAGDTEPDAAGEDTGAAVKREKRSPHAPAPEPVAEPRPRRMGWWQRRSFF